MPKGRKIFSSRNSTTMKELTALLAIFVIYSHGISHKLIVQEQWENFKIKHDKFYKSEIEENYRLRIYMENLHKINEHNKLYEMGLISYNMNINQFGDLSKDEFMRIYTIKNYSSSYNFEDNLPKSMQDFIIFAPPSIMNVTDLPGEVNWIDKGAVTPVKSQGSCGSCWSFSATGVLEGQWYIQKKKLISLSEQNLMDCSWKYENHGCSGGLAIKALRYVKGNGGVDTEESYRYNGKESKDCRYKASNKGATVSKVVLVPSSEKQLQIKVGTVGPMAVSIELSEKFQFYHKGVFDDPDCGDNLGHAVLVVGYGTEGGKDFWLVKNSWGKTWGEKGYIRMARNRNNQCGITCRISYPIV